MLFKAIDAADQRGLAGAGRAADDDFLALLNDEIDVSENVKLAEPLVQADHLYRSRRTCLLSSAYLRSASFGHEPSILSRRRHLGHGLGYSGPSNMTEPIA
jgi:hypothetical protein